MKDFNYPPYFDDYDETKGYYKMLFRPSVAVQARELNQMQTMVQKQIERFGSHIFREGSLVVGGAFDLELDIGYVTAASVFPSFDDIQTFVGKTVTGATTGIQAVVRAATFDTDNNCAVFMVRYLNASSTSATFLNSEVIKATDSLYFTASSTNAIGKGSIFGIAEGVVFTKGYFVAFTKQTIILTDPTQTTISLKYTQTPSLTIGFNINESVVTDLTDSTLLDNAAGSYNENAPGAHRYAIDAVLTAIAYRESYQDPNFVVLMNIKAGFVETTNERSEYARIYEELAKRTYDESGDYYVRGLGIRTREHLDTGSNEGLYTTAGGGDSTKLSIDVEPGVAYVKGFEVNKLITSHVITDKSLDYEYVNNQLINARTGGYLLIKEVVGTPSLDKGTVVNLFSNAELRVTRSVPSTTANGAGTLGIGTARVKSALYEYDTLGKPTGQLRLYLYDINMTGNTFNNVKAVGDITAPGFFADVILSGLNETANSAASLQDKNDNDLLFSIGSDYIRTIRGTGGVDTSFTFHRTDYPVTSSFNTPNTGVFTLSVSTPNESLGYSDGALSSSEKRSLIVAVCNTVSINLAGTVAASGANNIIAGTSTFFDRLSSGDRLTINGVNYYINTISSNTSLVLTSNTPGSIVANVYSKSLQVGDLLDLTARGSTGNTRTASVSGGQLSIDLKEDTTSFVGNAPQFKVTYNVNRSTAREAQKILKSNRYVRIQVSNNAAGKVGPYNLGLPDVYKLDYVRMHTSQFTTEDPQNYGTDVTSSFTLNSGQTDNLYDHAKLYNTGNLDLTGKFLIAKLDHFDPDYSLGLGYFSIDSYPIDDTQTTDSTIYTYQIPKYKSTSGQVYNLRNVLDFRPVKVATAVSSTLVSSSTINPATTTTITTDSYGLRTAIPDSAISADYSYYLARIDLVTLDKNGSFGVIQGEASRTPKTPIATGSVMSLAKVYIPPYPSVSETLGRILGDRSIGCVSKKLATIRYTMREIGVMKDRIDNLEYYNALTLLEKSAKDLKITDNAGLDRFKNGFFVDGFLDHSLGDTGNSDYKICVDKLEQCIRPFFEMEVFPFQYDSGLSSGAQVTGTLVTRPYTETTLLQNKNVTSYRNVEQGVFRFIGTIELTPDTDNWVDTSTIDKSIEFGNDIPTDQSLATEWGSWQTYITGYSVYDRAYGDRTGNIDPTKLEGTYSTYAEALAAAKKTDADGRYLIVTNYSENRTGINTSVSSETQTQDIGDFVTDVSIIPYIRPQNITVFAKGLKANTLMYLYFDGENMSDYATKLTRIATGGTVPTSALFIDGENYTQGVEGNPIRSDEYGELVCTLRLPADGKRFRTGTKEVILTDSPTNAIDATTYAKSYFVASGLNVTKQHTIISTKVTVITDNSVGESRSRQVPEVMGPSCMAYSFLVNVPETEDGIFLTSVDVWFQAKHATLGVWFEIREMQNGSITRNQVPYSETWFKNANVNTWDGTSATETAGKTNVKFSAPVFLMNNTEYAFVIHTEGLNPDYYMWVSRLGETDVLTNKQVTGRQLTGTLYTTNNNLNYDMVPDVDLKVAFNRAQFTVGSGSAYFGNKPVELINLKSGASAFARSGEAVKASQFLTLSSTVSVPAGNTIIVGDIITVSAKGLSANILSTTTYNYTDGIGFAAGDSYTIANSIGGSKNILGTIVAANGASGTLRKYSSDNNLMIIDDSNGLFFTNCVITGLYSNNTGQVNSFSYFPYSTTTIKPYYLTFKNTDCGFEKMGYFYSNSSFGAWYPGIPDNSSDFNEENRILSRVDEISTVSSNSSSQFRANFSTTSEYVSPVIDTGRAQSIFVHNLVNNSNPDVITLSNTTGTGSNSVVVGDRVYGNTSAKSGNVISIVANVVTTDTNGFVAGENFVVYDSLSVLKNIANTISTVIQTENLSSGGSLWNKYISKVVTLADGQDAEDIVIKLTTYRPPGTDVKVWVKIKHAEDGDLFSSKPYILMDYDVNYYSSAANKANFVEIDYTLPTSNLGTDPSTSTANVSKYTSSGQTFYGFKQYAVKIGLFGSDSSNPPKVADLRAIALQK